MVGASHREGSVWRHVRGFATLLAILAVALNGFAPGLHRVAMARAADDGVALCTSDATAAAHPPIGAPQRLAADDCCGLCILGGAALLAPSAIIGPVPILVARLDASEGASTAFQRAPTGPPLPARGPPLFS